MDLFDGPGEEMRAPPRSGVAGLSRRQLLRRVGGGAAGLVIASVGLEMGPSAVAAPGPISLRDLLRRISDKGCDPSHGIRVALPGSGLPGIRLPVISIRDVARRYAGSVVDFCQPLQFFGREEKLAVGVRLSLVGTNFTGGGRAALQYWSDLPEDRFDFSVQVRPDGTFAQAMDLPCTSPGQALYRLRATDVATGRSADGPMGSYMCAQAPPPPPPPPTPPPTPPVIRVSPLEGFAVTNFTVTGSLFVPDTAVEIRVVDPRVLSSSHSYFGKSDAVGGINHVIYGIPCSASGELRFSASDGRHVPTTQDITGLLWSNTVPVTCPSAP